MLYPTLSRNMAQLFKRPAKPGDIGIELEIEGINLPRKGIRGWSVKPENSLRGLGGRVVQSGDDAYDVPFEYVLTEPVSIGDVPSYLSSVCRALTKDGVTVNLTPRASTHIHINMMKETLRTVFGFLLIFTMAEPVILRLCGQERNGNLFCMPSYETGELPDFVTRLRKLVLTGRMCAETWPGRGKYASLNTDPMSNLGSLEARCFPNSIDPDQIYKWATWLMNIRLLAANFPDVTYQSLLDRAQDEPQWFIHSIFGNESIFAPCYPTNPPELIHYGVEQAYEAYRSMKEIFVYDKKSTKIPDVVVDDLPYFEED